MKKKTAAERMKSILIHRPKFCEHDGARLKSHHGERLVRRSFYDSDTGKKVPDEWEGYDELRCVGCGKVYYKSLTNGAISLIVISITIGVMILIFR